MLDSHEVFTTRYMGWAGLKNGTLLRAAVAEGFQVLVTGDQTLTREQNLGVHNIAVVVLSSIELRTLKQHLSRIVQAIDGSEVGKLTFVECGVFSRKALDSD